jgi:hypothetical protein
MRIDIENVYHVEKEYIELNETDDIISQELI